LSGEVGQDPERAAGADVLSVGRALNLAVKVRGPAPEDVGGEVNQGEFVTPQERCAMREGVQRR
jgi:hypothetical protein